MKASFSRRKKASKIPVTYSAQELAGGSVGLISEVDLAVRRLDEMPDVRVQEPADDHPGGEPDRHLENPVAQLADVLHERHPGLGVGRLGAAATKPGPAPSRGTVRRGPGGVGRRRHGWFRSERLLAGLSLRERCAVHGRPVCGRLALQVLELPLQILDLLLRRVRRARLRGRLGRRRAGTAALACGPGTASWPSSSWCRPLVSALKMRMAWPSDRAESGSLRGPEQQHEHHEQDDDVPRSKCIAHICPHSAGEACPRRYGSACTREVYTAASQASGYADRAPRPVRRCGEPAETSRSGQNRAGRN